jgi:hypothetical protein
VKLCSRDGVMPKYPPDFIGPVWPRNLQNLSIWQTVGRDVENGWWAIHGARAGTYYLMMECWDHRGVQDFECLDRIWEEHKDDVNGLRSAYYRHELNRFLGMNIVELDDKQSKFFKEYISRGWRNKNIMTKEIDVVRELEGW